MSKIVYLTCWYEDSNTQRRDELIKCVSNVLKQGEVDEVYLLDDSYDSYDRDFGDEYKAKLRTVHLDRRPTYNDFFRVANAATQRGDIIVISNTDTYPELGFRSHLKSMDQNDCYALSRYDEFSHGGKKFFDRWDSQDTWIFKSPISGVNGDFMMGKAGCDNAIAHRIWKEGYNIQNPSRSIQINHLHNSGIKNYNPDIKVKKPYLLITPHFLGEKPQYKFPE